MGQSGSGSGWASLEQSIRKSSIAQIRFFQKSLIRQMFHNVTIDTILSNSSAACIVGKISNDNIERMIKM